MDTESVILAVASPPGRSLRGVVRASGSGALDLLEPRLQRPPAGWRSRGARAVRLGLDRFELPAILLTMPGPKSYTGEDSFELLLPGNPHLLNRVIDELLDAAASTGVHARRADGGEFTARAFFNRRLTLTEAEGINATIAARSDAELRAARLLTSGALGGFAHELADDLASALALVEAGIDFTDQEDVVAIAPADLLARVRDLEARIESQIERATGFEELESIPWVVLVGEPNAGKSTLFNALLGRERAVVSNVAGTTRDILAEPLHLSVDGHDAEVMLVDIAGLDAGDESFINAEMQRAAREAIERAELIIECAAPVGPGAGRTSMLGSDGSDVDARLVVRTKADLLGEESGGLAVSAATGAGLDDLRRVIAERLSSRAVSLAADALALQPRHDAAFRSARDNLREAIDLVSPHADSRHLPHPEFVASCLRAALDDLAALAGDISPDDVLGRIFASFCVGK